MSQATARILDPSAQDYIPESELVDSDGEPLDSAWERKEINLFNEVTHEAMAERGEADYYVGGDMFVYYSTEQARAIAEEVRRQLTLFEVGEEGLPARKPPGRKQFRGPDVFVVMGGVEQRRRKVWASWLEGGRLPDFILELQSPSTAHVDADEKPELYARVFRSREYFRYGPDDQELARRYRDVLAGFRLGASGLYEPIEPNERGWVWSEVLGLFVGRWDGVYQNEEDRWIRLYDAHGRLIPTRAETERQQKEAERRRADAERRRADAERQQKEAERRRADAERRRAEAAEAEAARLRKLLESGG